MMIKNSELTLPLTMIFLGSGLVGCLNPLVCPSEELALSCLTSSPKKFIYPIASFSVSTLLSRFSYGRVGI